MEQAADQNEHKSVINSIPSPDAIRARLGEALREVELLRQLLKVSERAAKEKRPTRELAYA